MLCLSLHTNSTSRYYTPSGEFKKKDKRLGRLSNLLEIIQTESINRIKNRYNDSKLHALFHYFKQSPLTMNTGGTWENISQGNIPKKQGGPVSLLTLYTRVLCYRRIRLRKEHVHA